MNIPSPSWENPSLGGGEPLEFGHLGGTSTVGDPESWYPELWSYFVNEHWVSSFLDVGCGVGVAQKFMEDCGCLAWGVDCEQVLAYHKIPKHTTPHDFTKGICDLGSTFDLVWCCEVAEHIEEDKVHYLLDTIAQSAAKLVAFCAAPPKAGGHHHVNCQLPAYWRNRLAWRGLEYDDELTRKARSLCGEAHARVSENYFARSGLVLRVPR